MATLLSIKAVDATLSQTDGRDKVLRLIQYVCKTLRWLDYLPQSKDKRIADKLAALESALASSRQAWRLFKWASAYANAKNRTSILTDSTSRTISNILSAITDVALLAYYAADNTAFMSKLGLLRTHTPTIASRAARFWLLAVVAGILNSALRLRAATLQARVLQRSLDSIRGQKARPTEDTHSDQEAENNSETRQSTNGYVDGHVPDAEVRTNTSRGLAILRTQQRTIVLTALRQACDIVIAGSGGFDTGFHPAFVGICGTASSAIGLLQIWSKAAQLT